MIGRFISADALVPNPANSQAFNRYGYAYNNPIRYNDPSGHNPDPDPNNIFALPFEGGGGEQAGGGGVVVAFAALVYHLFVQPNLPPVDLPNPAPPRSAGIESYPSGSGEAASSLNNSSGGGLPLEGETFPGSAERGPYTAGGHITDSGQTLNDLVLSARLDFKGGFTRKERKMIRSVANEHGLNLSGIELWRGDGAPGNFSASWDGNSGLTFYDNAFSSRSELAKSIYEELIHRDQGLTSFGGGNVQAAEEEADNALRKWWKRK